MREGLEFGSEILTDCAPLNGLAEALFAVVPDVHMMRDPTRVDVWVVTLPETLPVSETVELLESLKLHGQSAPRIVMNRWPADPFHESGGDAVVSADTRAAAGRTLGRGAARDRLFRRRDRGDGRQGRDPHRADGLMRVRTGCCCMNGH